MVRLYQRLMVRLGRQWALDNGYDIFFVYISPLLSWKSPVLISYDFRSGE
jgi:hypothetical protein